MVNKDKFIAFLNYIGITNEIHHARLYKTYMKFWGQSIDEINRKEKVVMNLKYKKYRMSNYKKFMEKTLKYDEDLIDTIIEYLTYPEKRIKMDIEISKYKNTWGKELKNEIIL